MINLGIIGLGGIARSHLHLGQLRKNGKFFVKAAADIFDDDSLAKKCGIDEYYNDYRKLLADPSIDAVLIATPHHLHEEHCVAAFRAGKHALIEKPISRDLREARVIMDAAKEAGTVGMIGFCQRFYPVHAEIKQKLDEGVLGRLVSARIDHYQNFNPAPTSWWRNADMVGGGAVIGSGVHRLDLLRWYFGEPVKVYASAVHVPKRLDAEACVHAVIEFDSGVIVNFSINWASYKFLYGEGISISGEDGLIVCRTASSDPHYQIGLGSVENGALQTVEAKACETMYDHFASCIEQGKDPITTLEEGYLSLRLVRAIYRSIETGLPVDPTTVDF